MPGRMLLSQRLTFSAVHFLEGEGARAQYHRAHGHTFEVEAGVHGAPDAAVGWVADLASLSEALDHAVAPLRDRVLNEVDGLERATLEHLCLFIAGRLRDAYPGLAYVEASRPSLGQRCRLDLEPQAKEALAAPDRLDDAGG